MKTQALLSSNSHVNFSFYLLLNINSFLKKLKFMKFETQVLTIHLYIYRFSSNISISLKMGSFIHIGVFVYSVPQIYDEIKCYIFC